jgi:hypothetical protein
MGRRPFLHGISYLFLLFLILGLASGTTLASEPGAASGSSAEAAQRLERIRSAVAVHQRQWERLMEISDVVGSGVGLGSDGEPIIKVFTAGHSVPRIPGVLDGVPVHTEVSGRFYALRGETCEAGGDKQCTAEERWPLPVPTGVSVGHPDITAGTIAARVTKDNNVYILSNNHVLANINQASNGDPILQPGAYDGGTAEDAIATLTDYEVITFCEVFWIWVMCDTTNTIDAAIALSDPMNLGFSTPVVPYASIPGYGAPSQNIHPAYGDPSIIGDPNEALGLLLGAAVQKYGRTTRLTAGTVDTINAAVDVCYDADCMNVARFTDQLTVTPGDFSAGGDSGSLVVSNDNLRQPVGLLFAGSDTITIINRIDHVLKRFGVTVDGGDIVEPSIDVAVTGIDVPTPVSEGQTVTVIVTVENRGQGPVTGATVALNDLTEAGAVRTLPVTTDLALGESKPVEFQWTPMTAGSHALEANQVTAEDANPSNDEYRKDINVLLPPGGPQLQVLKVMAYTDQWATVELDYEYGDEMVVICSPSYDLSVPGPAITRVRNATGSSFEVGLGRPWYGTFGDEDFSAMVHCMVVRQGVYSLAGDGVKMEAVKIPNFTASDHTGSWSGQRRFYQKTYTRPVVVGQVVSPGTGTPPSNCPFLCDLDWSVFWSRGTAATNPPSSSVLYVGRHTGEDTDVRPAETLAYVVIEKGSGTIEGKKYVASLGTDIVRGMQNVPPYTYSFSGLASPSVAVVSQAGMDAADGGWPVLYGPNAVRPAQLRLAIDEDWYLYSERKHTTEQVFYIVFE